MEAPLSCSSTPGGYIGEDGKGEERPLLTPPLKVTGSVGWFNATGLYPSRERSPVLALIPDEAVNGEMVYSSRAFPYHDSHSIRSRDNFGTMRFQIAFGFTL